MPNFEKTAQANRARPQLAAVKKARKGRHLRVQDLMSREVFTLYEDDSLKALKDFMDWRAIRHVPVVDQGGRLVGLATHRDFLRVAISALADIEEGEANRLYEGIRVGDIMGHKVTAVSADTPLKEAAATMARHKFGCLPVVDEQRKVVGIITEADFVRFFIE